MYLCSLQFVVAVGLLLVAVLAFTYPQNTSHLGLVNLGSYNWSSPLSHVRLLSLPIAKKYNLQGLEHYYSISLVNFTRKDRHAHKQFYSSEKTSSILRKNKICKTQSSGNT